MTECEFCGQTLMDGQPCNCAQAKAERQRIDQLQKACRAADNLIDEAQAENADMVYKALKAIVYGRIQKASFTFCGGVKANLSMKDGAVKIERTEIIKDSMEV